MLRAIRLATTILLAVSAGFGQSNDQSARFKSAANKWMLTPVDVARQRDTTTSNNRALRDAFWDKCCGQARALTSRIGGSVSNYREWVVLPNTPEIPLPNNSAWIVGRFENSHTYLSQSQRSIYTEVNVKVERVFGQTGTQVNVGDLLDVGDYGGTIKAPWGETITYQVEPLTYHFQPGHRYLLLVEYKPDGQFYIVGKRWELSNGRVEPEGAEAERARSGKSELAGLDETSLNALMTRKIAELKAH